MADDKLILAYRSPDAADAALLAQALEAVGIHTVQSGGQGSGAFGELGADALQVEIWIPADQAELGRKTIDEVQRRDAPDGPDWNCSKCGETNEGDFEICWSCQAPHAAD